ncbi:hypothetical protein Tco_0389660 [Tanacetum coccineum]
MCAAQSYVCAALTIKFNEAIKDIKCDGFSKMYAALLFSIKDISTYLGKLLKHINDDDDDSKKLYVADEIAADNVVDKLVNIANIGDAHTNVSAANAPESDPLDSSMPKMVADAFEKRMLELLSDTLKNILP